MKKERQKSENEKLFEFAKELRDTISSIEIYKERIANLEDLTKNGKCYITIKSLKCEINKINIIADEDFILLLKEQTQKELEQAHQKLTNLKKHITL